MLALNAHIRRDNPIRAVEQTEGVLRVAGEMPAASGKPDHERINLVLQNAMDQMLTRLAQLYDPTIDDRAPLFGTVLDPAGLYSIIAAWREESWRNAEQLRHARAIGGVKGPLYQAKLAAIEAAAKAGAEPRGGCRERDRLMAAVSGTLERRCDSTQHIVDPSRSSAATAGGAPCFVRYRNPPLTLGRARTCSVRSR